MVIIKCYSLTSDQKLKHTYRILFISRKELLITITPSSAHFGMKGFGIQRLEDMIQKVGEQDHETKPHWTFVLGTREGSNLSELCTQHIATKTKYNDSMQNCQ